MTEDDIKKELAILPSGGITTKKIRGKAYVYYQWSEEGRQHSRIVRGNELEYLKAQIEKRKDLQRQLNDLQIRKGSDAALKARGHYVFLTDVRIGKALDDFSAPVRNYERRELYSSIERYIYGGNHDNLLILYGLRRTGKTTLIRQIICDMDAEHRKKAVFIQCGLRSNLADMNKDLKTLESLGYKYVFIDEATMMDDFIEGAALFSDVYASSGMKIVLSGTDSLGFAFSEDEQLYDRCIMLHTTYIPFFEFEKVLGICDVDRYIEFGGTMSQSGDNYNDWIFASEKKTSEYVNTAIARNIQHSLRNYQNEGHFRSLKELYDRNELTNVINRIVEDMNHDFTIQVITRTFKSHDFGSARDIMRKDRDKPTDILDDVDGKALTKNLMRLLEIINKEEQTVEIKDINRKEIKEYLDLLDLTYDIPVVSISNPSDKRTITVFSQPGLRYSQAESLVKTLMADNVFKSIEAYERKRIIDRILGDIKGRMLEEIVLLETSKMNPDMEVFKLQFAVGELDMVIFDPDNICCRIYEIKHSKERNPFQYRHLANKDICDQTEFRYGRIQEKTVLYRGETYDAEHDIKYKNVEEYLLRK